MNIAMVAQLTNFNYSTLVTVLQVNETVDLKVRNIPPRNVCSGLTALSSGSPWEAQLQNKLAFRCTSSSDRLL